MFRPVDRGEARARVGLPADGRVVVSVGRLAEVKGHDLLLRALGELAPAEGDPAGIRLVLIGEGDRRGALERQARELGLEGRVRFEGEVAHERLADWYGAADLLCLPSRREGWPNVLMEAMACGTPCVASRVGGAPEILGEEEAGLLADPDDAGDLARALRAALARSWDRRVLVARAGEHSWERAVARIESVLAEAHADSVSP
jgi:glycosyltransferase involved in cell wall biosynthesis